MVRSLSAAVARCIRARPASDDALIADKLASFVFTDTARDFVAAVRRGEEPLLDEPSSTSLEQGRAQQQQRPAHVHMLSLNGRTSWGGMALFRDDIFPEGFYRTRAVASEPPMGLEKRVYAGQDYGLLFEQPYFRWTGRDYEFRLGDQDDNATLRLLEHLIAQSGPRVDLWRGTQTAYDSVDELLEQGDDGRVRAGAMSTFGDNFASVMTTPDRKAAEGWANPTLLRFSFAADEVRDLARAGLLYAGVEFGYLELALLYDRDPQSTRGHASLQRLEVVSSTMTSPA